MGGEAGASGAGGEPSACDDGTKNGDEAGIDCGGSCPLTCDTDGDGIVDADDPNPKSEMNNMLNGIHTGGAAAVVAITATLGDGTEDSDLVQDDDLEAGCEADWEPQGTLCDEPPETHSPIASVKTNVDSGATWSGNEAASGNEPVTGILVIDACSDGSCDAIDFNDARVFQMYSDGKATQLRLAVHPDRSDSAPAWDDAGWETVTGFEELREGTDVFADGIVAESPAQLLTGPQVTRYVRVEVRNDGSFDGGDYIELRSVKLFAMPLN